LSSLVCPKSLTAKNLWQFEDKSAGSHDFCIWMHDFMSSFPRRAIYQNISVGVCVCVCVWSGMGRKLCLLCCACGHRLFLEGQSIFGPPIWMARIWVGPSKFGDPVFFALHFGGSAFGLALRDWRPNVFHSRLQHSNAFERGLVELGNT
jgi:hypothetical protein